MGRDNRLGRQHPHTVRSPRDASRVAQHRQQDPEAANMETSNPVTNLTLDAEQRLAAKTLLRIPYCPHRPTKAQAAFLLDMGREALYGGAAGGGKSDALLMAALQFIRVPGYAALILRRSYTDLDLPGALMDRAAEWLASAVRDKHARWNSYTHSWEFKWGASLTFGYIRRRADRDRYRSAEFQYIGWDELTQFEDERDYTYLFSRCRRPRVASNALSRVPLRVRAATNPGGEGHAWVRRRFIEPWIAWRARGGVRPARTYHPATLDDLAEHIDVTEYEKMLRSLDQTTWAQLRWGDWDVRQPGRMFNRGWFVTIPASSIPSGCEWVRCWDLAATTMDEAGDPDWTVGALVGRAPSGIIIVADIERFRSTAGSVEARIRQVAERDGRGVPIRVEQEPGAAGKILGAHMRMALAGWDVSAIPSTGSKATRAMPLAALADATRPGGSLVRLVEGAWVEAFLDEVEAFPDGAHDDQVDAVASAVAHLTSTPRVGVLNLGGLERRWMPSIGS